MTTQTASRETFGWSWSSSCRLAGLIALAALTMGCGMFGEVCDPTSIDSTPLKAGKTTNGQVVEAGELNAYWVKVEEPGSTVKLTVTFDAPVGTARAFVDEHKAQVLDAGPREHVLASITNASTGVMVVIGAEAPTGYTLETTVLPPSDERLARR